MNYDQALQLIKNKQSLGIMPGLSRIRSLLAKIGDPQDKLRIIHIAGTNGKGTVAHTIAAALHSNGLNVGLFTSPWITDYCEQIMINGVPISHDDFADIVGCFSKLGVVDKCSEFELVTAIMYYYFCGRVDYAVVECGMGGKGDATNVEKQNVCSVITSVSLDHTGYLGDTIEKIIAEKEGIIRPDSPCFRYHNSGDIDHDNLALARDVVRYLGYDTDIPLVKPPARQEYRGGILVDGGHNRSAAEALAPLLNNEVAVIGMMKDKDVDGYLSCVAPRCKRIICTDVSNPRAISADDLAECARNYCDDVVVIYDPADAVAQNGVSLICGSFYLIREIINLL